MSIRSYEELRDLVLRKPRRRALSVANGGLSSLPDDLDGLTLNKLEIYTNATTTLPEPIRRQKRLWVLELQSNPLDGLPDWLSELPLRVLRIERAGLTEVALGEMQTLEELRLAWNPIARLSLASAPKLHTLDLANHGLEHLEAVDCWCSKTPSWSFLCLGSPCPLNEPLHRVEIRGGAAATCGSRTSST